MDFTIVQEQAGPACKLRVGGDMSIYSVAELKPRLMAYLQNSQFVSVDLTEITEMDTAGLQLLWLCHQEAVATGKEFVIAGTGPAAKEAMTLLRLDRQLNLQ